jgi:hypothetical protein
LHGQPFVKTAGAHANPGRLISFTSPARGGHSGTPGTRVRSPG